MAWFCHACDRCDRNPFKPLFTAIKQAQEVYRRRDFSYILPISQLSATPNRLNIIYILLHSVSIICSLADLVLINIFATNLICPLWTISLFQTIPLIVLTISIYFIMMLAVHLSLFSPFFLHKSKWQFLEKSHFISLFKSLFSKSIAIPIAFSISPLLLLNMFLWMFILGNSPALYFKPNLIGFHDFHCFLHKLVIPRLNTKFHGLKSSQWVRQFVYILFNAVILDEYIMKKNSPHRTRVSFIGMLGGDDTAKVMKRVHEDLDGMNEALSLKGVIDKELFEVNATAWKDIAEKSRVLQPETENAESDLEIDFIDPSVTEIGRHLQYLIYVLYPMHLLWFWIYIFFNGDGGLSLNMLYILGIAAVHFVFCITSICILYIHSTHTVNRKPQQTYIWTHPKVMNFYCSFHDDDEQKMYKTKLNQYLYGLSNELKTALIIRDCLHSQYRDSQWLCNTIISFCCVINDEEYAENSYESIMRVISRWTRHEHQKCSSSKASIMRNSMQIYLGVGGASRSFDPQLSGTDGPSFLNPYFDEHDEEYNPGYMRKSSDSAHSQGASGFRVHHKESIGPIMEGAEQKELEPSDESYGHSNISPEDTHDTATHEYHERGQTTKIAIGPIAPLEEQTYDDKTLDTYEHHGNHPHSPDTHVTVPTHATEPTYPSVLKQESFRSDERINGGITPAPPTPRKHHLESSENRPTIDVESSVVDET